MADLFYDKEGRPIPLMVWASLFGDWEYKCVAETYVGPYRVSTIWLGLDHDFFRTGRPLIFEMMVFGPEGASDVDCRRYTTEADALAAHEETVTVIRATVQTVEDVLDRDDTEDRQ